ncbi:hypothetical protein GUITHDRAFT_105030 [Guillardia theta CCMP2712]|uniref:Uncharacterized protein n=1 Tax=Guillardia theta (strain CCMP2712) TaxID=905079 RepID=L1JLS0_GUITC|nr:hypothetical protein GUITHDRAFT_105030 [Guillardia theta CCMP2712]EKX49506.1 hypothetical protein GUITHDRAFT_105030 [Guillardia theta CCMP2712]|eukprot:XP_005836486.1 hypothetical protein GUITHDRAFT_105030 [Guillardia theta CCMP2712]
MAGSAERTRRQCEELQNEISLRKEDAKHLHALIQKARAKEAEAVQLAEEREQRILELREKVEKFRRRDVDRAAYLEETRSRHLQEVIMLENIIKDLQAKLDIEAQQRKDVEKRCARLESRLYNAKAPAAITIEKLAKARHALEMTVESFSENQTNMQQQLEKINLAHVAFYSNLGRHVRNGGPASSSSPSHGGIVKRGF